MIKGGASLAPGNPAEGPRCQGPGVFWEAGERGGGGAPPLRRERREPLRELGTPPPFCGSEVRSENLRLARDAPEAGRGEDHLVDDGKPVRLEEHVLRAAQADPLRAERPRSDGVPRVVRVRPHFEAPCLVRPAQERLEVRLPLLVRGDRRDAAPAT